ncbi:hypothetical protein EV102420_11_00570 [Pseudescherichia vulneris NBRC 102420]|uniref:Fimbrial-type adhesion domain-containing protein n=1 Tax=Pseudescherichia vulneris NBRC 102420 TaxID=1115515 RepID=A0A090VTL3_PSEVU|nr:fimbrial protein [Pseudescherichia vulneris]GAL58487.1 hypothetical protein EV102420_11_00570 [Pseudescherichia vulneris NBRC 102420]STQ60566.1 putative minor fimbrial subunit AufD [Pseudescherichia vulneris]
MQHLKRHFTRRNVIPYCLFLLTLGWASFSEAGVTCSSRYDTSITIDLGNITVPADLPVGGDITGDHSYDQYVIAQCEGDGKSYVTLYSDLVSDGVYNSRTTFKTNIPGVGIQMGGISNNYSAWITNGNTQQQIWEFTLHFLTVPIENYTFGPMFKLVKISDDIESGTLSGQANHVVVSGSQSSTTYSVYLSGTINATPPHVPGCTVDTASVPVTLGKHSPTEFSGVGSTTPFTTFSIPLTCESDAQITARVDATQDTSGAQSVIQIPAGEENASGVGVQLYWASLNNSANVPVNFGKDVFVGATTGGTENLQFEARYYQTQNALFPGNANTSATVTLSYQ